MASSSPVYGLTPRQADALAFIRAHIKAHGYPPSYQEIADQLGISSKSGVSRLLTGLAYRGHIDMLYGRARSIALREGQSQ